MQQCTEVTFRTLPEINHLIVCKHYWSLYHRYRSFASEVWIKGFKRKSVLRDNFPLYFPVFENKHPLMASKTSDSSPSKSISYLPPRQNSKVLTEMVCPQSTMCK